MRIGIKVGSSLLTSQNNGLSIEAILSVCQQIARLIRDGDQVFLVTSGAVASDPKKYRSARLRASVGMGRLISRYISCFDLFDIEASQMLLIDRDLHHNCRKSLIELFNQALSDGVVPIVNANDAVDWVELDRLDICADNDILFKNLCLALNPDLAIIGFDQAGVLGQDGYVIDMVYEGNYDSVYENCRLKQNDLGHGQFGMETKVRTLRELANFGIKTLLAPGKSDDFILRAVRELQDPEFGFGTHFAFGPHKDWLERENFLFHTQT